MSASEIHVGDMPRLTVTFKDGSSVVDISGATTKQIWIRDSTGTDSQNAGVFTTNGTDGKLYYDALTGTFDVAAEGWEIQGHVTIAGSDFHTDVSVFRVYANADRA